MTTSLHTIQLGEPSDLIAAVGHLLGFQPMDSIVLVGHQGPHRNELGVTLRADLPPPRHEHALAERLVNTALVYDSTAVTLLVVGGHWRSKAKHPPRSRLISTIALLLESEDLPLMHAGWVRDISAGQRWYCYQDDDCGGTLPDPSSSALAASCVAHGVVTFPSREELADLLRPEHPEALARREKLLDEWMRENDGRDPDAEELEAEFELAELALRDALDDAADDSRPLELTDERVVRLAVALSHHSVRDEIIRTSPPVDSPAAQAAERLWLALTRATPAPERAEPACLLGHAAYLRGDGALAGIALDVALEANPAHVLAGLLRRGLDAALPPAELARLSGATRADGSG